MKDKYRALLYILLLYSLFNSVSAQKRTIRQDSVITFKVFGNCEMCKERIENAARGKGAISSVWDVESKLLTLNYDPKKTSPDRVEQRIADAGHDPQLKKAKDFVYNDLPDCCHYREK